MLFRTFGGLLAVAAVGGDGAAVLDPLPGVAAGVTGVQFLAVRGELRRRGGAAEFPQDVERKGKGEDFEEGVNHSAFYFWVW